MEGNEKMNKMSKYMAVISSALFLTIASFTGVSHAASKIYFGNNGGFGNSTTTNKASNTVPNVGTGTTNKAFNTVPSVGTGGVGGGYPACFGKFTNIVANIIIQTGSNSTGSTLQYGLFLTPTTEAVLGPLVNVRMVAATVNGKPINPPFGNYFAYPWDYTFHGSLVYPNYMSGYSGPKQLQIGDVVSFAWGITSDSNNNSAWGDTTCQIV